ncbi:MAG: hypothetical protein GY820_47255, partial [Gammaproteobacteria bacterium]|nr:hypothetical protein [Gammaproteobacteria bacterium]
MVNVDQLSRCYAGLSVDGPLQFSHTVRPRRANRKRRAKLKADVLQQTPDHQMVLRQTDDLNFDGAINSTYTAISPMQDRTEIAPNTLLGNCAETVVKRVHLCSLVLFSDRILSNFGRCEDSTMSERRKEEDRKRREEDRRRKEEDEKRKKEDAHRKEEDARRLREDKERREQKRTEQYAQEFGKELEGGASKRKHPHQRQSYSPPRHSRPSGQTRATSHYIPRGQQGFQQGVQQFEKVVAQGRPRKRHESVNKEQDSMAEEAALQRRIDKIKADRLKRAEEEKERVALERKSRSMERTGGAQSQQKASSSQKPDPDRQSSAERKYSKERGPSSKEKKKQAQRSQSTGERSHRSRSRDSAKSSGSYPSPLADPATRYHQQVTQELQQYKGPLEFFRGGATSMASMSSGPSWESGRGWGGWRPGRGRGASPGGFPVWRGGRPFQGGSPSPRRERGNWGRGYQRYWQNRTRGYARGPPK